jgi:hypothetical protein
MVVPEVLHPEAGMQDIATIVLISQACIQTSPDSFNLQLHDRLWKGGMNEIVSYMLLWKEDEVRAQQIEVCADGS